MNVLQWYFLFIFISTTYITKFSIYLLSNFLFWGGGYLLFTNPDYRLIFMTSFPKYSSLARVHCIHIVWCTSNGTLTPAFPHALHISLPSVANLHLPSEMLLQILKHRVNLATAIMVQPPSALPNSDSIQRLPPLLWCPQRPPSKFRISHLTAISFVVSEAPFTVGIP
jgi:hypothetical protein